MDQETLSPHVFLFYGENTFELQKKVKFWIQEFTIRHGDTNMDIMDGSSVQTKNIMAIAEIMPFLSEKRLIIVNNFISNASLEEQKKLSEKLDKIPESSIVVFVEKEESPSQKDPLFKKIISIGKIEEFKMLSGPKLLEWVITQIQTKNGKIQTKNADYLIQHVGSDPWKLSNEMDKLVTYCDGREILETDIATLTKANIKTTIFKFTDYLGQKNTRLTIDTLNVLLESGEDVFYIFFMIVRQFRILIQVKDLMMKEKNQKQISTELKQHPFVITTSMRQAKNFSFAILKNIYQELLQIDIATKTGKIRTSTGDTKQLNLTLEKFILECCR